MFAPAVLENESALAPPPTRTAPTQPRVAYFPDSFHEVNGVAHTSRQFEAFARRRSLPFLCVRAGSRSPAFTQDGSVWTLELPRGFLSIPIEKDLSFDPAYLRHFSLIQKVFRRFRPDLVHVTGPSDVGLLGAWLARRAGLPIAASWHTNIHEYAARRSLRFLRLLSSPARRLRCAKNRRPLHGRHRPLLSHGQGALRPQSRPLRAAPALDRPKLPPDAPRRRCGALRSRQASAQHPKTAKPSSALSAACRSKRTSPCWSAFSKNSSSKASPTSASSSSVRAAWSPGCASACPVPSSPAYFKGEPLAQRLRPHGPLRLPLAHRHLRQRRLEALASGVPAIVTPDGGPPTIVRDQLTGRIVPDEEFTPAIAALFADPARLAQMRRAARAYALTASWDSVFEGVYAGYEAALPIGKPVAK